MKILLVGVLLLLGGCTTLFQTREPPPPQIITVKEMVPVDIYQPPAPAPVEMLDVTWFVVTKENLDEQIQKIEKMLGGEFVVFALLPDGYEKMAENLQEVRRFVRQQSELILYYREATSADWDEENEKREEGQDGPSEEGDGQVDQASDASGQNEISTETEAP